METARVETLHSSLNEGGRELLNVKFIVGTGRGLRREQVEGAAKEAVKRAFARGLVDAPPMATR
ncbi:hypothetical protein [Bosea vaviloviae]|uniref:hypothetical protein n=1 Tax=Bosea vaviloviae TaxID=1526658 RepID=UPI001314B59B|nr:hypothetical protein [Bosea vaviloviae]